MSAADAIDALLAAPIGRWLNVAREEDGAVFRLGFEERHIGNPGIRAIHGGVVAALLELAAESAYLAATGRPDPVVTANIDIDYLVSTRAEDMFARATILRQGRRIAFVEARAWQEREDKPVAIARFRMRQGPAD